MSFLNKVLCATALMLLPFINANAENTNTVEVLLNTNKGDITLELDAAKAPISVKNFVTYVEDKHYDGTIFHRVIKDFMVQGGGFDSNMRQKPMRAPIQNEAKNGLKNERGSIAMARTSDINSATSQFFINVKNNGFLDHGARDFGYAVFGKVTAGMEVVDSIATTRTARGDKPIEDIIILTATVITAEQE